VITFPPQSGSSSESEHFFSLSALLRAGNSGGDSCGLVGTVLANSANPPHCAVPPAQFPRIENPRVLKDVT
jgi:hypothetical protein